MIDIHAHIYPGIDDGSSGMEESLHMVQTAAESGVTAIVATPHCNLPGYYGNYRDAAWERGLAELADCVRTAGMPVRILPGMEICGTEGLTDLLRDGRIIGLNRTNYVLTEFLFREDPVRIYHWIGELRRAGYRPVLAHPERYAYVQEDIRLVYDWYDMGCVLQLNKGSILGRFGRDACDTAWRLLDEGLAGCVASDAHSAQVRTTDLSEVRDVLAQRLAPEEARRLLTENPERLLSGEEIPRR